MRVKVYKVDQNTGEETFERTAALDDLFDDSWEGGADALSAACELEKAGRVWVGGGAAPLFYVVRL